MWYHEGQFFVRFRDLKTTASYVVQQSADMKFWFNAGSFTPESEEHLWIHEPPSSNRYFYYRLEDKDGTSNDEEEPKDERPKVVTKPR